MNDSNARMLKLLKTSLEGLRDAQGVQEQLTNQLIEQLPEDKKAEAVALISKAKKGNVSATDIVNFASGVKDIDQEELAKVAKEGEEKIEKKKQDTSTK